MRHWGKDVMITRRGLIVCAAGLVVAKAALADLTVTPAQTAGPFYPQLKPDDSDMDLTRVRGSQGSAAGEVIEIQGRILSLKGHALGAAVVEIWQADIRGRYHHPGDRSVFSSPDPNFQGYGAVRTRADGGYRFRTVRPAAYRAGLLQRTPHIHFRVIDGGNRELVTQMYFPGEPLNAQDIIYSRLSGDLTRGAATARRGQGGDVVRYEFDLVLA